GKSTRTLELEALAKQKGYKNLTEYREVLAINKMVPLARALFDAGLNEEQVRAIMRSRFSKREIRMYLKKSLERTVKSRELISKGLLLPGKTEELKKRKH
ncbi:MAG: hypothetical protein QXO69_03610, partial [archaeon]